MDQQLSSPFRMIFRDFLSENEMSWLLEYSSPRLSSVRENPPSNANVKKHASHNQVRIVSKTVQVWMGDYKYAHGDEFDYEGERLPNPDRDVREVEHAILVKLSRKIELATRMRLTGRDSATQYQVTNYGLSGLCEGHMDPHGATEGIEGPRDRFNLKYSGDMFATFMAWLEDCEAGGATAYDFPGKNIFIRG